MYEHKEKMIGGFTKKYHVIKLVYYEMLKDAQSAISREKQIKGGSREKKVGLIGRMNPRWEDLYEQL